MTNFTPFKIAVLGSCASRDNFNRIFNPDYKELFELVASQSHVSLVSLMSEPIKIDPDEFGDVIPRVKSDLTREFARSFLDEIRIAKPEFLILDFWPDVNYGYSVMENGAIITHNSWSTAKSPYFHSMRSERYRSDSTPNEFFKTWRLAADKFMEFIQENLPRTKVIVHKARNVAKYEAKDGTIKEFSSWPFRMNKHWEKMDDYLISEHACLLLDVINDHQLGIESHPWGKLPVHYSLDYYKRFLVKLTRVILEDKAKS